MLRMRVVGEEGVQMEQPTKIYTKWDMTTKYQHKMDMNQIKR